MKGFEIKLWRKVWYWLTNNDRWLQRSYEGKRQIKNKLLQNRPSLSSFSSSVSNSLAVDTT